MDLNFYMPVQLFTGEGCVKRELARMSRYGRRCLILTGAHAAAASGALDDVMEVMAGAGVDVTVFPGIGQNPLLTQCQNAAFAADTCRADFLIGVGGGSVMDATKAAAWIAENITAHTDRLFAGQYRHDPLPFALVGLTAGTGSEVSPVAVLTCPDGRKRSVSDPRCYARMAFGDPRYTGSLPRVPTEASALDAFCHAAEGYLNPACSDAAEVFAAKALPLLADGLEALSRLSPEERPDAALRERLYYGSLWAGMVLNALGTSYPHPMGYVLTEDFGVPHGAACAVFLPDLLDRTAEYWPERMASFDVLTGGRDRLLPLLRQLTKADIAMTPEQAETYACRWDPDKGGAVPHNFARVAGGFTPSDARKLLWELFVKEN